MITLKDYIGKIYKDVTNAKVQSDIETLAIAQEYVQNPMLKHFSVPNIRVKNMELTIPVAVDTTQPTSRPYTEREVQTAFVNAFNASYLHFFPGKQDSLDALQGDVIQTASASAASSTSELRTANTQSEEAAPTSESTETPKSADDGSTEPRTTEPKTTETAQKYDTVLNTIAQTITDKSYRFIDSQISANSFYPKMISEVELRLAKRPLELQELPVIVETDKLKLIDNPASMITIKVNIMDDAMEWIADVDANGNPTQVLTYE